MDLEQTAEVACPYCGGIFTIFVDTSQGNFSTIEGRQICCRPAQISVGCNAGEVESVELERA